MRPEGQQSQRPVLSLPRSSWCPLSLAQEVAASPPLSCACPPAPVSGAATLQLFYPPVSDSEVFSKAQPCQRGFRTKGLFDFLFVFICRRRGRGPREKGLLGFKICIWVASFSEKSAPWNSFLSWGRGGKRLSGSSGGRSRRAPPSTAQGGWGTAGHLGGGLPGGT